MSFCMFARNFSKGLVSLKSTPRLTRIVLQRQFTGFNNLPNGKNNLKRLLVQSMTKNNNIIRNSSANADHRMIWTIERALSLLLLGVIPYGIISPSAVTDNLMAVLTVAHVHWGLEAIVVDYIRPRVFGPAIAKGSLITLYVLSALTLGGLLYYNFNNIGIGKTVRMAWNPKQVKQSQ